MIETAPQRDRRIKAEKQLRSDRAAQYAEKMAVPAAAGDLTEDEARKLTARINIAADNIGALLLQAHDRKAWAALKYESWREYASAEFMFSQGHAYRLLNFERVRVNLNSPMGENSTLVEKTLPVNERQVRSLAKLEPEKQVEAWNKAVESSRTGVPTAKQVATAAEIVAPKVFTRCSPAKQARIEAESSNLRALKHHWGLASETDQQEFKSWIQNN